MYLHHLQSLTNLIAHIEHGMTLTIENKELKQNYVANLFFIDKLLRIIYREQKKQKFNPDLHGEHRELARIIKHYMAILTCCCQATCSFHEELTEYKAQIKQRITLYQRKLEIIEAYNRAHSRNDSMEMVTDKEYESLFNLEERGE